MKWHSILYRVIVSIVCILNVNQSNLFAVDFSHGPLKVSPNQRYLIHEDGTPFFYLADTAWELFHRLNRKEVEQYFDDRVTKGFTIIQAVVLAELNGLTEPNAYGYLPLFGKNPKQPDIKDGLNNDYWDFVDEVISLAEEKGLYIGLLPTWGTYVTSHWANGVVDGMFDVSNAFEFGKFIGTRYKDARNIIWIVGGDRAAPTPESQAIWNMMAKGITNGVTGGTDYNKVMMTYHTSGPGHSSDWFHHQPWLDFNSVQSSHGDYVLNWLMIEKDYRLTPTKPIIDLETSYPDVLISPGSTKPSNSDDARRCAYWSVFAGSFGHTYGHNSIWQMHNEGRKSVLNPTMTWKEALNDPAAKQMVILRKLIESRPFLSRVPDQSALLEDTGSGIHHIVATRGDGYLMIYSPTGKEIVCDLSNVGESLYVWWFNPRNRESHRPQSIGGSSPFRFDPPGETGRGNDWVLVIDDATKKFDPPGQSSLLAN